VEKRAPTDAELVRCALAGDKERLGELILRHWPTANFLATRVLGSPELAGDAVQEAAIAAMTGLGQLRSPDRFGAWFCGITLNVARRWLRRSGTEVLVSSPDAPSAGSDPATAAELAEVAGRVRAAIALLADGQRDAVTLFYLQGLSHREVAAELGISASAVKARLHQARAALASQLASTIDIPEVRTMPAPSAPTAEWVDAQVTEIRLAPGQENQGQHIMVLTEVGGDRVLPIWIGPGEARAMALMLDSAETPRPFTYQLATALVAAANASVSQVRITKLESAVFYAVVVVSSSDGTREVDARPSDAINLALAAGAPIRVDSVLLEKLSAERAAILAAAPIVTAEIVAEHAQQLQSLREEFDEP
jgi:uncharacterized protein